MTREMDLLSLGVVGGPWACGPRVALWRPWVRDEDLQSTCWGAHADKSRRSKDTRHASTGNGHLSTAGRGLWAGAIHVERVTINGGIATSRYRGHACLWGGSHAGMLAFTPKRRHGLVPCGHACLHPKTTTPPSAVPMSTKSLPCCSQRRAYTPALATPPHARTSVPSTTTRDTTIAN